MPIDRVEAARAGNASALEELMREHRTQVVRDVLIRRDVLGEGAREAAAGLGISVEALKSRLHRARAEVKRRFLASIRGTARRPGVLARH